MPEIARLNGGSDCFELEFVERKAAPESAMKLGIHFYLAILSLSYTILIINVLGFSWCRYIVHNWVQKTGLQPRRGTDPDHIILDEP